MSNTEPEHFPSLVEVAPDYDLASEINDQRGPFWILVSISDTSAENDGPTYDLDLEVGPGLYDPKLIRKVLVDTVAAFDKLDLIQEDSDSE